MRAHLPLYRKVQAAARAVFTNLGPTLCSTDSEQTIVERAVSMLRGRGLTETWYYDCPALVLSGERSCLSVSGREYEPSDAPLGAFNLVTVDLSSCRGPIWGDCARSFCIEHGRYTAAPNDHEFSQGLKAEQDLHEFVRGYASRERTFGNLSTAANERLDSLGFENLDFLGNLGHSIERNLGDRILSKMTTMCGSARFGRSRSNRISENSTVVGASSTRTSTFSRATDPLRSCNIKLVFFPNCVLHTA